MKIGFLHLVGIVFLATSSLWAIEIKSLADAVNIAGKQRMYSQRMLKDYAMIGMNNTFGNPQADLKQVMHDFEDHLAALKKFAAKDAQAQADIAKVKTMWQGMKSKCEAKPTLAVAMELKRLCNDLLKASDKVVKDLVASSGVAKSDIVDLSGR